MSSQRRALLEAFIKSDAAPVGKWWVDFPVGVSVGAEGEHATVDAICLTSRDQELPEVYPEHAGVSYVAPGEDEAVGVTKADRVRALREKDVFAEETAVLVAAEPGGSSVGRLGELLAFRELLGADWPWTVDELILVSDEDSDHVNYVCRELSVRAVRVA